MPTTKDLLLFRTFQTSWLGKQEKYLDFSYKGPIEEVKAPRTHRQMENFVNNLPELGEDNTDELMPTDVRVAQNVDRRLRNDRNDIDFGDEESKETESVPVFISRAQAALKREADYMVYHYSDLVRNSLAAHSKGKLEAPLLPVIASIGTGLQLITSSILNNGPGAMHAINTFRKTVSKGKGKMAALTAALDSLSQNSALKTTLDKMSGELVSKKKSHINTSAGNSKQAKKKNNTKSKNNKPKPKSK